MARSADRALKRLPIRDRVESRIDALVDGPRPPESVKLVGANPRAHRLRQGDYRVVYEVDDDALEVTVTRVAHRDVYRRPDPT